MHYGICPLSIVPVRLEPNDRSEMITQLLFGEHFKALEIRKKWVKIRIAHDGYEGWICAKQWIEIDKDAYQALEKTPPLLCAELLNIIEGNDNQLLPVPLGASLPFFKEGICTIGKQQFHYQGAKVTAIKDRNALIDFAYNYLNAPYLWGGKTPFGIDCSGFTQMVYRLIGIPLLRDAHQQATQGESLSFIEEAEPGDLAFFDNAEGHITHVGIMLGNYDIIHASGKVRIDKIDHQGIFNKELGIHTHQLRLITRML